MLMLVFEPPFDFGAKNLLKGFITLLISVLIFMYFSNSPWFSKQELLFRSSLCIFFLFKSASIEAFTDLLLWHVTSHIDEHGDLGRGAPAGIYVFVITHVLKFCFRKPNLSAYNCMHSSQNLHNAAIVLNKIKQISITKNFPFGNSTKTLGLLLKNFYSESHLAISRHPK